MGRATQATKKELHALACREMARENNDVLSYVDKHREIVELPEGLETGETKRRKRGNRTDLDCINEICEIVAQGITATAAVKFVGVPWATWHKWLKLNHHEANERYDFAVIAHLEAMADKTLLIYEELKARREAAKEKYNAALREWRLAQRNYETAVREWRNSNATNRPPEAVYEGPTEPIYDGPEEWELSLAEKRVKVRQWQLEARAAQFRKKQEINNNTNTVRCTVHEVNINDLQTPEEALRAYHQLIEGKV